MTGATRRKEAKKRRGRSSKVDGFSPLAAELRVLIGRQKVPRKVIDAAASAAQMPEKFSFFVFECDPAPLGRKPYLAAGLYPSDLLLKLVLAARAAKWEEVVILISQALSPEDDPS